MTFLNPLTPPPGLPGGPGMLGPGIPGMPPGFSPVGPGPGTGPGALGIPAPGGFPGMQPQPPAGPPPSIIPQQPLTSTFAIDPGAISGCLFRYTYIWPRSGVGFWFYPVFVGRTSVAGFRWNGFFWTFSGLDLGRIESFSCF